MATRAPKNTPEIISNTMQRQAEILRAWSMFQLGGSRAKFCKEVGIATSTLQQWICENTNGFREKWNEIQAARREINLDLLDTLLERFLLKVFRDAMGEVHAPECEIREGACTCTPIEVTGDGPSKSIIAQAVGLIGKKRDGNVAFQQNLNVQFGPEALPEIMAEIRKRAEAMERYAKRQEAEEAEFEEDPESSSPS